MYECLKIRQFCFPTADLEWSDVHLTTAQSQNKHTNNSDKNQHAHTKQLWAGVIDLTWVITVVDASFLQVWVVPPVVADRHGGLSWGWGWRRCRGLRKA